MSFEKFLQLPVWKVFILIAIIFTMLMATIEELFISRVFGLMDKSITHFEKIKAEEIDELEEDSRDFNRREKEDHERWRKRSAADNKAHTDALIKIYCDQIRQVTLDNQEIIQLQAAIKEKVNLTRGFDTSTLNRLMKVKPKREADAKGARTELKKLGVDEKNCAQYSSNET